MKLSKKGEYALRALIDLSMNADTGVVQAHDLARKENIPGKFLEQILLTLKNAGLLQSRRGVGGGYSLARPPDRITLGEVIRLIDGPLAPIGCASKTTPERCSCPDEDTCGLRSVMLEVSNAISNIVDRVTLADVCRRAKDFQSRKAMIPVYVI